MRQENRKIDNNIVSTIGRAPNSKNYNKKNKQRGFPICMMSKILQNKWLNKNGIKKKKG